MPRRTTAAGRLARLGFADPARAEHLVSVELGLSADGQDGELLEAIGAAADPDLALAALARMPRDAELMAALREDAALRARLIAVLGTSAALGDHLARHPDHWRVLRGPAALAGPPADEVRAAVLREVGADPQAPEPAAAPPAGGADAATQLRGA